MITISSLQSNPERSAGWVGGHGENRRTPRRCCSPRWWGFAPPPPALPEADNSDLMWPGLLIVGLALAWLIITGIRQMSGEKKFPPAR